jgi:hypothetical protein
MRRLTPEEASRLLADAMRLRSRWRVQVEWVIFSAGRTASTVRRDSFVYFRMERRGLRLLCPHDELPIIVHETSLSAIDLTELKGSVELAFRQSDPVSGPGNISDDDGVVQISLWDGTERLFAYCGEFTSITQAAKETSRLVGVVSRRIPDGFGK